MLADYQRGFIEFALANEVLQFGEFTLKSGRVSPYFFNAGKFGTGSALSKVGEYYAAALAASDIQIDCLFGPAYKGIPLVVATATKTAEQQGIDMPYVFNRKEAKDHGEGGSLVGSELKGKVVIVDDVITAGTAIRESLEIIEAAGAEIAGVLIAIDRQERGKGDLSAIQEVEVEYNVPVISVISLSDIAEYLDEQGTFDRELNLIGSYRSEYGIAS